MVKNKRGFLLSLNRGMVAIYQAIRRDRIR